MKYNFTFSLALLLCFSITLLAQDKDYHITASIKKYPSNAMAYLRFMGPKGEVLDSATINDGSFTFKGKIDEPRPAHIVIRELGKKYASQHVAAFYIEPGDLEIEGNMLFNATITGSPATIDKKALDKLLVGNNLSEPTKVLVRTEVVAVPAGSIPQGSISQGRSRPAGGTVVSRRTITDMNELPFEVQSKIKAMQEESKGKVLKFIKEHPESFVSMYTVNSLWGAKRISYLEYISLINGLSPILRESNEGKVMFAK